MLLHNDHRLSKQTSACWRVPEYSRLSTCVQFSHLPCSTFTQTTYQSHLATILLTMTTSAVQCKLTLGKIAVDLAHLAQYCWRQCLKPSITKTVSSTFHLHNNRAGCELNRQCLKHNPVSSTFHLHNNRAGCELNSQYLKHNPHSANLGITRNRMLRCKSRLSKMAAKLKSQKNLLSQLAGKTWSSSACNLQISALHYWNAEYGCPVSAHSSHVDCVNSQFHSIMWLNFRLFSQHRPLH